jgi:hypothetical protein
MRAIDLESLPNEALEQIALEHDRQAQIRRRDKSAGFIVLERSNAIVDMAKAILRRRKGDQT